MRDGMLVIMGILVGVAVQTAVAQNGVARTGGVVALNHVGLSVPNVDEAVAYYTKTLGFREAFRATDEAGQPTLVYVQVSRDTFVELQPSNAQRPPGISHFGLHVDNMPAAVTTFRQRGATVGASNVSANTRAVLANITDLNGVRVELAELTPDSLQQKAMASWK